MRSLARQMCVARKPPMASRPVRHRPEAAGQYGNQAVLRMLANRVTPGRSQGPQCSCDDALPGAHAHWAARYSTEDHALGRSQPRSPLALSPSRYRCASGSTCEKDEPSLYRDPSGVATCNEATGNVDAVVLKEQCAGNCILEHENTHATDLSTCCQTFSNCINNAADIDGRNKCRANWQAFLDANEAWTECNAYNIEGQCLTSLIHDNCNVSGGPVSEDCCASLQSELNTVAQRATAYCANSAPLPCPLFFR